MEWFKSDAFQEANKEANKRAGKVRRELWIAQKRG